MKQNDNSPQQRQEDFTVISFSSAPNESLEFSNNQPQQQTNKQGYCFIIGFVILGFYFLVFGIIELSTNFNEIDCRIQLNRNGNQYLSTNTFISFTEHTEILIYLEIQDLTQFDIGQGDEMVQQCRGHMTNQQMGKNISITNATLDPNGMAIPCGKFASYYPEGTFQIIDTLTNKSISVSTNGIAHTDVPFATDDFNPNEQWASVSNERYQSWMTVNAEEKVKKLWGRIAEVVSGTYQIKLAVNNEMPQVDRIFISLTNNQALSGYNNELCYLNFFYAILVFIGALANFLIQKNWGHRKVFRRKPLISNQSNEIKFFLNSAASTPAVKFE